MVAGLPHSIGQIERKLKTRGVAANYDMHFMLFTEFDFGFDPTSYGLRTGKNLLRIVVDYCCHVKQEKELAITNITWVLVMVWPAHFAVPGIIRILRQGTFWHAKDRILNLIEVNIDDRDLHEYKQLLPALRALSCKADWLRSWSVKCAIRRLEENLQKDYNYLADADW